MTDKECNYKNNDHCTIDTNYCAPNNTGQHCFIRKYADERQENKALREENERLRKALEEIIAPGFFITGRIEKIAKAALQPEQEKSCKSCLRFKSDNPLESCTSKDEDNWCGGWTSKQEVAL